MASDRMSASSLVGSSWNRSAWVSASRRCAQASVCLAQLSAQQMRPLACHGHVVGTDE